MMFNNIKSALNSLWTNKVRSLLTILGVVIGVSSVTTLVSLGEGLKNDVSSLIRGFGTNVLAVLPGKIETTSSSMNYGNPADFIAGDILTLKDAESISQIPEIEAATPLSLVAGTMKYQEKTTSPMVMGTYPNILQSYDIVQLDKGEMFKTKDQGNVIVIGPATKEIFFSNEDPIGQRVIFAEEEFTVIGLLKRPKRASLFSSEFDNLALIPFDTATKLNKNQEKIFRLAAKAKQTTDVNQVKEKMHQVLLDNHRGEENFTVFTQEDILDLFNQFLDLSTILVSAIAAISLIVGGIGIMNIMLLTVTERTKEIGLRKALGATRLTILLQFLVEAVIITLLGGIIGLLLSFAAGGLVAFKTPLTPVITPQVILLAFGLSVIIGIIFGLWPAWRASRKDPIQALRYE